MKEILFQVLKLFRNKDNSSSSLWFEINLPIFNLIEFWTVMWKVCMGTGMRGLHDSHILFLFDNQSSSDKFN